MLCVVAATTVWKILSVILLALGVCCWFGGVASWFVTAAAMIAMVSERLPGVPFFRGWESPFNVAFHPEQLTEKGKAHRRLFLRAMVLGPVLLATGLVIAAIREKLRR
jgi:hypothetical protein